MGETYTWRSTTSTTGAVDLTQLYEPSEDVTMYAWARIEADAETGAVLALGSECGVQVWLNGELVHDHWVPRPVTVDEDVVGVRLRPGTNALLLKVSSADEGWGFVARFLGSAGATSAMFRANDDATFRALMAAGADLNATNADGHTPLNRACHRGETDAVLALLALGASVDAAGPRGFTPLHEAAAWGHGEIVSMLLSHGAAVDALALADLTPLHVSRRSGYEDVARLLIEGGADETRAPGPKREQVDALFSYDVGEDTPGAAVLVARGDEVLLEAAYGMANLEHGIPVTAGTIFRIGSITKQFTAVGILLLEQDGLLKVEDPLSRFMPEYPRGDEITLRHLLSHTSGVFEFARVPEFWQNISREQTHQEFTARFRDKPLDFEPGAAWRYSNSGYHLLGMVIEHTSGMAYEEFMQTRVFSPLGMRDTGYDRASRILKRRASGYDRFDGAYQNARFEHISTMFSGGGLYSTVGDLHTWNRAIMHGRLLRAEAMGRATTRAVLADGSETRHGFGWFLMKTRGLEVVHHAGACDGFDTWLGFYPDIDATVVVLANSKNDSNVHSNWAGMVVKEIYFQDEMGPRER